MNANTFLNATATKGRQASSANAINSKENLPNRSTDAMGDIEKPLPTPWKRRCRSGDRWLGGNPESDPDNCNHSQQHLGMHELVWSPEQLQAPVPTEEELTRGRKPLDLENLHAELAAIGAFRPSRNHQHEQHLLERVFGLGSGGRPEHYQFPWLDPGTGRWEEDGSPTGGVVAAMAFAVERLYKLEPDTYEVFEEAAIQECLRISDTRNPTAARTLAFVVYLLLNDNPEKGILYRKLERKGVVQATLLAPHWKTISAAIELYLFEVNTRLLNRMEAYLLKALKRPNSSERWPIIAHYLAGLSNCDERAWTTLRFVQDIAKEHLDAIGQELKAEYKLLALDDPDLPRLQDVCMPGTKPPERSLFLSDNDIASEKDKPKESAATVERQDDDAVMGLDDRFFLKLTPESDVYEPLVVNTVALMKAYPSITNLNVTHYVRYFSNNSVLEQVVSPKQWQAAAERWPQDLVGVRPVKDQLDAICESRRRKVLCSNLYLHADLLYAFLLVHYGREKINPSFQATLRALFPKHYQSGNVKSVGRTFFKARDDYRGAEQPRAARVRDVVRCILVFATCGEMVEAFDTIRKHCTVTGVKNAFAWNHQPGYGYRQVLVSVLHEVPGSPGDRMICEIQMHLASYVKVREQLKVYYNIFRCKSWRSTLDFVGPESRETYWHLGGDNPSKLKLS